MTKPQVGDRVRVKDRVNAWLQWHDDMLKRLGTEGVVVTSMGAALIEFDSDKMRAWIDWAWLEKV